MAQNKEKSSLGFLLFTARRFPSFHMKCKDTILFSSYFREMHYHICRFYQVKTLNPRIHIRLYRHYLSLLQGTKKDQHCCILQRIEFSTFRLSVLRKYLTKLELGKCQQFSLNAKFLLDYLAHSLR